MSPHRHIVQEFLDCLARADFDALFELVDPEVTWRIPGRDEFHHRDDVRKAVFGRFPTLFDGPLRIELDEVVEDGEIVFARAHGGARIRGGGEYRNRYAFFCRIRDGKIVELEEFFDSARALTDLAGKKLIDA